MKNLKALGFAVVAMAAVVALIPIGTASASVLCKTTEAPCPSKYLAGTTVDLSRITGGSELLTNTKGESLDTCTEITKKGKITKAGSSTETVTGEWTEFKMTNCTFPTKPITLGRFEVHSIAGHNGQFTSDATTEVTINTVLFGSCIYGVTSGTSLGTLTGGNPGQLDMNAVAERFSGSAFACPETANWTGTFFLTEPSGTVHVMSG